MFLAIDAAALAILLVMNSGPLTPGHNAIALGAALHAMHASLEVCCTDIASGISVVTATTLTSL